jgi:hypothetical protein
MILFKVMLKMIRPCLILFLMLTLIFLVGCNTGINRDKAISITQDFVNNKVKFYVNEKNESSGVEKASINVVDTIKKDKVWEVYLNIKSNQTGILKESNVLITINAQTGQVLDLKNLKG